ncbi:dethiobiotin synthase [Peptoniphilus indolicus]|uniref:ATP-dependent dethiobiotin synthetase BioD n=2 Tax=Peptoniphilus indolicus TaxID=33030 RepID=G4D2K4_9FIRM|nr:dethiobiotin synthase [Peptoniphilus indolicus]EGY80235.1 dethiobiotin synthetase [Peptoniphilus indolicus ATCC 29427]SUB75282.1 ATP-dependent dethiobiotin synthetase BioD 1 [Peptoniphilus indolicus]
MKGLFIVGTDTDIGKTYVTALLLKKMLEVGMNAIYYKGALSGAELVDGKLVPGDAAYVKEISGIEESVENLVPYVYETAVSPHLAAQIEGNAVELGKVVEGYKRLSEKYDYVVMEGSGGIICPINYGKNTLMLEDFITELNLPSILIADAGLGTINHTFLTAYYMKQKGLVLKGVILNNYDGSLMQRDNLKMIEELIGVPVIAKVEHGNTDLDIEESVLRGLF